MRGTVRATLALVLLIAAPGAATAICVGDCNDSGDVRVDELVTCVNIALDRAQLSQCLAIETNTDGEATINELITAVNNALRGCQMVPTPTPDLGNQPPQVDAGDDVITAIDQPPTLTGSATDDGMPSPPATVTLAWSKVSGPGDVVFGSPTAGSTTATFSAVGSYVLRLSANDSARTGSDDVTVHVDISAANVAPTIDPVDDQTITAGSALSLALVGRDGNPFDALSYSLVDGPQGAQVATEGIFAFAPLAAQLGAHAVTVRVQDPDGLTAETSFDVMVVQGNRPPAVDPLPDVTTPLNVLFTQTFAATDPDAGDVLTFTLLSAPPGMTLAGTQLSWTPAADQFGTHIVSVAVSDGRGGEASGEQRILVPAPGAPTARDDVYEVVLGRTLTVPAAGVLVNDTSVDGGAITGAQLTQPDKGSVSAFNADGSFTYVAPPALPPPPPLDVKEKWLFYGSGIWSGGPALAGDFDGNDGGKAEVVHFVYNNCLSVIEDDGSELINTCSMPQAPDGKFCSLSYSAITPALVDVDDDGQAEIVTGILCTDSPPAPASGYADRIAALSYAPDAPSKLAIDWISPTINDAVDVNGDVHSVGLTVARLAAGEPPSVLFGLPFVGGCNQVDPSKTEFFCRYVWILDGRDGSLKRRLYHAPEYQRDRYWGRGVGDHMAPIVADLEGDGSTEVIFQGTVWDPSGAVELALDGADFRSYRDAAVGDLDGDGTGEIVLLDAWTDRTNGQLLAFRHDGKLLWRTILPGSGLTSRPTLADLDRDGRPEILFTIWNAVFAVDARGSIRWLHPLSIGWDNNTTVAVYDLNGDGVVEVIVQDGGSDVVFLDGRDGREQTRWHHPTDPSYYSQGFKKPMVVDLDADGAAEVVIRRDVFSSHFVVALEGDTAPWRAAPSRFPQFAYSGTGFGPNERLDDGPPRWWTEAATNVFSQQPTLAYPSEPRRRTQTTFTYAASDDDIDSEPATVTIDILPENRPPVITGLPPATAPPGDYRGAPHYTFQITAVDPDPGDVVTFTLTPFSCGDANQIRISPEGLFTFAVWIFDDYDCLFQVQASDGNGGVTVQPFRIFFTNQTRTVPALVGLERSDALVALLARDLITGREVEVANPAPAGTILLQNPPAETSVPRGSPVDLTVSLGPGPLDTDDDGDGVTENQGDCDDADPALNPERPEVPDNGIDENCDGSERIVREIVVEPRSALRVTGEQIECTAIAVYIDGTSAEVAANWASSSPNIASIDAAGLARALNIGSTTITATFGGAVGRAIFSVADRAAGDQDEPTAIITAPAAGASLTALTQITGTADDPTFLRYELAIAPAGEINFTMIGAGTGAITNGVLGTLDPSLIENGFYVVRLMVFDSNENEARAEVTVQIEGALKAGNFTLTYNDLTVPLAGLSVQVTRSYDSRDRQPGDFGAGWRLGINTLRLSPSGVLGTGWQVIKPGLAYALLPVGDHRVSITLPSGRVETFELRLSPTVSTFVPLTAVRATYVPRPGTMGRLESLDNDNLLIADAQPGPVTLLDDTTLNDYHPDRFRYTALDGTQFVVSRTQGVSQVRDPNGNGLSISPAGIIHSAGPGVTFTRDAQNRITAVVDPKGQRQTYSYSPAGDLVGHTDAANNTTRYFYDHHHGLIRIEDPLGRPVARNDYGDDGRLVSVTDAGGHTTTYTHDVAARETLVEDALGRLTLLQYDAQGNVIGVTNPLGERTSFTYDDRGNELTSTDPLGAITTRTYDANDQILSVTDPLGHTTTFTRDATGRPLSITDPRNHTTALAYDERGNLTTTTDALGRATVSTYDANGNPIAFTDPTGATSRNAYDAAGRRTQVIDPLGTVTGLAHDANGNLLSQSAHGNPAATLVYDADNRIVATALGGLQRAVEYDSAGQIAGVTTAFGQELAVQSDAVGRLSGIEMPGGGSLFRQEYDAAGNIIAFTDAVGNRTERTYDAANRLILTRAASGATQRRMYDAAGQVTEIVDALGRSTRYTYDAAGQVTSVTDALGGQRLYEYDAAGNTTAVTDPAGRTTRYVYDAVNELVLTTFADGTTEAHTYDGIGRPATFTDEAGRTTSYSYNALGHLMAVTDAIGNQTRYEYANGAERTATRDPNGNTTRFSYDAAGRLTQITHPMGATESATYDHSGNVLTRTNGNGETVQFVYNGGRLVRRSLAGSEEQFTYTPDGLLSTVTDPRGTTSLAYDPSTRLLTRMTEPDGRYIRYAYDAVGNRVLMAHGGPAISEAVTRYEYDALNRAVRIVDPTGGVTTQSYDAVGNLVGIVRPNGGATQITYDARHRIASITERGAGNAVLASETYTLDPRGNRTRIDREDGARVEYAYDALGRVTHERHVDGGGSVVLESAYAYDAAGNLIASGPTGMSITHAYNADNQLISRGPVTYAYDAAGRRAQETAAVPGEAPQTVRYGWDADDRLTSFEDATGAVITYEYDAYGVRQARVDAGGSSTFLVDRTNATNFSQIVREDGPGVHRSFLYGSRLLQTRDGPGVRHRGFDGLGSTSVLTDATGAVTDRYSYRAYGETLTHSGSSNLPHQFAGEEHDAESGLSFLRARYYDPRSGTFLSRDPADGNPNDPLSLHPYLYGHGNPVNRTDPSGRETLPALLVSATARLNAQGQQILRIRRAVDRASETTADSMRTVGGILSVLALTEMVTNDTRVQRWFGGGKVTQALVGLSDVGEVVEGVVDVFAAANLGRAAYDMVGNGKKIDFYIEGVGILISTNPGELSNFKPGKDLVTTCPAGYHAFALKASSAIKLCLRFFQDLPLPDSRIFTVPFHASMAGVMVHEFTHLSFGTEDTAYNCMDEYPGTDGSKTGARGLARAGLAAPGATLKNADSYRCWVEDSALGFGHRDSKIRPP